MRQRVVIHLILIAALTAFGLTGCSGGSAITPETPQEPAGAVSTPVTEANAEADSGHFMLMSGTICLNPATGEVTNIPDKTVQFHFDATQYVTPPHCWNCITFPSVYVTQPADPMKHDWHIKVKLRNPTPYEAYEVRAIFFPQDDWTSIVNFTGLTKVFGNQELHPYVNWIVGEWMTMDKFYGNNWAWATWIVIRIPYQWGTKELALIPYKIDASWPGPIKESPDILHGSVTQDGAWFSSFINGYVDIPVWDWQGDISHVFLELTELSPSIGAIDCTYAFSEYPAGGTGPNSLHHYHANVYYEGTPPASDGEHTCAVTVVDSKSKFALYDYITVTVGFDYDEPVSFYDGGEYEGLIDLMNGDAKIRFYYDHAVDPSGVIYVFYYNAVKNAWDKPDQKISMAACNEVVMNWPPAYPACYLELELMNGIGNWWSVDAWDSTGNKAHTAVQQWGQPMRPVERWHKLAGDLGDQNTNWGSPLLTDMDNDGDEDVVIANRMAKVFCFDGIGGDQPTGLIWVYDTHDSAIYSAPAAADVTGDNIPEVFISTNGVEQGAVHCINGATGFWQWSTASVDIIDSTVCLTDLDQAGGLDVVVGDNSGRLYALNGTTGLPMWAQPFKAAAGIGSSPAAGDVTYDDIPDLAFGAYDGYVYMVNGSDGTLIWKYNCGTGLFNVESSPALFDADGDTVPDVVVGADDNVYCFKGQGVGGGNTVALWSNTFVANFRNSPAIGDCNKDTIPDVVITGRQGAFSDLFIIDGGNGDGLWGMEVPGGGGIFTNVILADVTADGHMNAIFGANDPFMADTERYYIVNVDRLEYGVLLVDMETTLIPNQAMGMPNAPTLGDVDQDGKWDLAFGSVQGRVYVHDFDTEIPADADMRPWTTFAGNDRRDGNPFQDY